MIDGDGRDKVREALDALDTIEAQLEAIGAGGVQALSAAPATPPAEQQAEPDECFPGEPKVAVPQGFRDGQSTTKQEG